MCTVISLKRVVSQARSCEDYLNTAPDAAPVIAHARRLLRLERLYEVAVPGMLTRVSRVANIKSGIVVIHADNGVAAAKIRQIAGRLTDAFSKRGVECSGIEVRVQPSRLTAATPPKTRRPLSRNARACLDDTLASLPADSTLRAALRHLLDRADR